MLVSEKDNIFVSAADGPLLFSGLLLGPSAPFDGGHIPGVCGGTERLL